MQIALVIAVHLEPPRWIPLRLKGNTPLGFFIETGKRLIVMLIRR